MVMKIVGVTFIIAAALGVIRFTDPLQRMHASTKAGTVGAQFVLVGVAIEMATWDVVIMCSGVILFLLLTVPIAGHLLGRATYVSGAKLTGTEGRDALQGVLQRRQETLDDRLVSPGKRGR